MDTAKCPKVIKVMASQLTSFWGRQNLCRKEQMPDRDDPVCANR